MKNNPVFVKLSITWIVVFWVSLLLVNPTFALTFIIAGVIIASIVNMIYHFTTGL